MNSHFFFVTFLAGALFVMPLSAQTPSKTGQPNDEPSAEDPIHDELRALREDMLAAFRERDVDRMLKHVHEDALVTFQNAELARGPEGVREFYEEMMEGDDRKVESVESDFNVDERAIVHGEDTAIAWGDIHDHFTLTSGMEFELSSRWTATLVKEDDRWQIAAYHVSTNMFDNGVSELLIRWASIVTGAVSVVVGLVLGVVVTMLVSKFRKKRQSNATKS